MLRMLTKIGVNEMAAKKQQGLTLVELLVAMVLGALVLAGVGYIYVGTQHSYRFNEQIARLQENGRIAVDILAKDLRMAGYAGCQPISQILGKLGGMDFFGATVNRPLYTQWFRNDQALGVPTGSGFDIADGAVGINYGALSQLPLDEDYFNGGNLAVTNANVFFREGDLLLITDCEKGEFFAVDDVGNDFITPTANLQYAYSRNAMIILFNLWPTTYAVIPDFKTGIDGIPLGSLVWNPGRPGVTREAEMVEGVRQMYVEYGLSSGGWGSAVSEFKAATDMSADDWANAISVRIQLLMSTPDSVLAPEDIQDPLPFGPEGSTFDPSSVADGSRRLYQVFSTVVSLRNRSQ